MSRYWLLLLALLMIIMASAALTMGFLLLSGFREARQSAAITSANLAQTLTTRLDATFGNIDALLDEMAADSVSDIGQATIAGRFPPAIEERYATRSKRFSEITRLTLFDAHGKLLYASDSGQPPALNISDRPYFEKVRDDPQAGIVISDVILGRLDRTETVAVVRGIRDSNGQFLGVAGAVLNLSKFRDLFKSIDLGPNGIIALRRSDNFKLVMRWPDIPNTVNQPVPPGSPTRASIEEGKKQATLDVDSLTDGIARIFSLRSLDDHPLYVMVALGRSDVLAGWYWRSAIVAVFGLIVFVMVSGLVLQLWRTKRREDDTALELAENERRLRLLGSVFEHAGEALMVTNPDREVVTINPAFTKLMGYEAREIIGQRTTIIAADTAEDQAARGQILNKEGIWHGETFTRRKDGSIFPTWLVLAEIRDGLGRVTHRIGALTDITERKAAEQKILELAYSDALTGLPNRLSLNGRTEQALSLAKRTGNQVAVIFIDMDRFKAINDSLGHAVGDQLLIEVGRRLTLTVRESDIVARLGGDEFVVVLTGIPSADVAARQAEKILATLGAPYVIEGNDLNSTPSVGVAMFPNDGDGVEELMKNADAAMYSAKSGGRNNYSSSPPA